MKNGFAALIDQSVTLVEFVSFEDTEERFQQDWVAIGGRK